MNEVCKSSQSVVRNCFFAAEPWAVDVMSITNCKIMVKIITGFSCLLKIWNWKHMTLINVP